jgi:hypothetical protein
MSEKKKCEHSWGRIWLKSKAYQEQKFCTKCLELKNATNSKQTPKPEAK